MGATGVASSAEGGSREGGRDAFWASIGHAPADYAALDWTGLVGNIGPVTVGNIVGGTILVGAVYWLVYLRGRG